MLQDSQILNSDNHPQVRNLKLHQINQSQLVEGRDQFLVKYPETRILESRSNSQIAKSGSKNLIPAIHRDIAGRTPNSVSRHLNQSYADKQVLPAKLSSGSAAQLQFSLF